MTVCLAAICDGGKHVVVAADRMITASYPPVEFEHDSPKLEKVGDACVALTAGDALAHVDLFRAARGTLGTVSSPSIFQTAGVIQKAYVAERLQAVEQIILGTRGWDLNHFYTEVPRVVPAELVYAIDAQISQYDYGLEILLAGVDTEAHIYLIRNPGRVDCFDSLGYNAIGLGGLHALSTFISNRCSSSLGLNEAVYLVFEAKRRAEIAPGVGKELDMAIVSSAGVHELTEAQHKILAAIYDKRRSPDVSATDDEIRKLDFSS